MVSHPSDRDPYQPSHSLSRRAGSVASASSYRSSTTSRHRHRSTRSHAGGTSTAVARVQNEFPVFNATGDVEILITAPPSRSSQAAYQYDGRGARPEEQGRPLMRYLLHHLILEQNSGFFAASLSEKWDRDTHGEGAATPRPPQRQIANGMGNALAVIGEDGSNEAAMGRERGVIRRDSVHTQASSVQQERKRWRYELDWGSGDEDIPLLIQKPLTHDSLFGDPQQYQAHQQYQHQQQQQQTTPRPPTIRNKPTAPDSGFFRTMSNFSALHLGTGSNISSSSATAAQQHQQSSNGSNNGGGGFDPEDDIRRDYDNLFRIFYHYPPTLENINIAAAYVECKSLLHLADVYDALEVVGPHIDHHLLRFQGRLFKQIAKYPPSYLKLGYLARSRVIFSEALVHVVGQWPLGASQLRGHLDAHVLELIQDKSDDLAELQARIETRLYRLTLTTARGERVTPSNSYLDWLAMSLFRQWLAENTTPAPAPILKQPQQQTSRNASRDRRSGTTPGGGGMASLLPSSTNPATASTRPSAPVQPPIGRIFRQIAQGGQAYLNHDEVKRFLKLRPEDYTRTNVARFERRLDELKNLAAELVRPLTRNTLELDLGSHGVGGSALPYLTCTRVEDLDIPWDD